MKVLVFGHWLEIGGTQVNAIELSARLRDAHGHDVVYFATPGPMRALLEEKRLRYEPAPPADLHPSPPRMRALDALLRRERPDVLHAWDWWQAIDAYYVARLLHRVPMVVTDMSMGLVRLLPKALPTTFGTPELAEQARAAGRRRADVLLPPVDVVCNAPGAADGAAFRARHGVRDGDVAFVSVSRLSLNMKSEPLWRLVDVVRRAGREVPIRMLVVGDGEARPRLESLAAEANAAAGREAVTFVGSMLDPRPAYAGADVVVGMGGSALRAMAFGKALLVVGERGFSDPLTPSTAGGFLRRGLYGLGDGDPGNARLEAHVRALAADPSRRAELGAFARRFVTTHFALEAVGAKLDGLLRAAAADPGPFWVAAADGVRTALVWTRERRFLRPEVNARLKALLVGKPKREFSLE